MAFQIRAERLLGRAAPAPLDHGLFLAALSARRPSPAPSAPPRAMANAPLVELLLGGASGPRAALAQRGCFNRAEAGRRRNGA